MIQYQKKNKIKNDFNTYAIIDKLVMSKVITSPWLIGLTPISHPHS